jgi:hypothetical protein
MPLYLDTRTQWVCDDFKRVRERMNNNMTKGFPPRVTLKAGRGSRTRSRRSSFILILDIQNHFADLHAVQQLVDVRSDCQAAADADRRLERGRENREGALIGAIGGAR